MRITSVLAVAALVAAPLLFSVGTASAGTRGTFIISPNPVTAGDSVTFSGTGCVANPGDPIDLGPKVYLQVQVQGEEGTSPAITPAVDGSWSLSLDMPVDFPAGSYTFGALCDRYTDPLNYDPQTLVVQDPEARGAFMFLPAFGVVFGSTPQLLAGASYEVDALGFDPGESVVLTIHSTPVKLATFVADGDGLVSARFVVPAGTALGAHTLEMAGLSSGLIASLDIKVIQQPVPVTTTVPVTSTVTVSATKAATVTLTASTPAVTSSAAPAATTTSSAAPALAATGTAATSMTAVGVALTLGGAATLLLARRSRGSRSH